MFEDFLRGELGLEENSNETQILDNVDKDNLEEAELEDVLESVPPEHRKVNIGSHF